MSSARSDLMKIKTIVDSRPHESPSAAAANERQSSMASPVLARHVNRQFRFTLYIKYHTQCITLCTSIVIYPLLVLPAMPCSWSCHRALLSAKSLCRTREAVARAGPVHALSAFHQESSSSSDDDRLAPVRHSPLLVSRPASRMNMPRLFAVYTHRLLVHFVPHTCINVCVCEGESVCVNTYECMCFVCVCLRERERKIESMCVWGEGVGVFLVRWVCRVWVGIECG